MVQFQVEMLDGRLFTGTSLTLRGVEGYVVIGDVVAREVANVTILKPTAAEPLPPPAPPVEDSPMAGGSPGVPGDPGSPQEG